MPDLSLGRVLRDLHGSEINAGIETLFNGGVRVWLGDETAPTTETTIAPKSGKWPEEDAARWLHATALHLFPDSPYAKSHSG
jgi:hypothetical protein